MENRNVEQEAGTQWAGATQHHHLPREAGLKEASDGGWGAPLLINY